jgi:hypothetical protein
MSRGSSSKTKDDQASHLYEIVVFKSIFRLELLEYKLQIAEMIILTLFQILDL